MNDDILQQYADKWNRLLDTKGSGHTTGNCFQNAANFVMEKEEFDGEPIMLCHGMVWHPEKSFFHAHAWLEWGDGIGMVIDPSNGNTEALIAPVPVYYEAARIDPNLVTRYTREECMVNLVKTENWGPWNE